MRIASVSDLKARFVSFLKKSEDGPVIVTRKGRPVAVLLSIEDEDELEWLVLTYSPRLRSILDTSRRQIREGGGIGHEEFWEGVP